MWSDFILKLNFTLISHTRLSLGGVRPGRFINEWSEFLVLSVTGVENSAVDFWLASLHRAKAIRQTVLIRLGWDFHGKEYSRGASNFPFSFQLFWQEFMTRAEQLRSNLKEKIRFGKFWIISSGEKNLVAQRVPAAGKASLKLNLRTIYKFYLWNFRSVPYKLRMKLISQFY